MTGPRLDVRLVGPVSVSRAGAAVPLPRSRKLLALLGLLTVEGPQPRSRLCDLLWDAPSDPRGELRWCLSKLRAVVDDPDRPRVVTTGHALVGLDLVDATVDAQEIVRAAAEEPVADMPTERLAALCALFRGDLLEGVELDATAEFTAWLAGQRQRFRTLQIAWTRALAARPSSDETEELRRLQAWLRVAPLDRAAHEAMLTALLRQSRHSDADSHLASAIRAFEQEGVDWTPLRSWWRSVKGTAASAPAAAGASRSIEVTARATAEAPPRAAPRRASVAVMPFAQEATPSDGRAAIAHGITDDIITRLAKLRALFVIARGTTHALGDRGVEPQEAGRILNVEYVVTGRARCEGRRWSLLVELAETEGARIVWTDEYTCEGEGAFGVFDDIVSRVVATIAEEIETAECRRAMLNPPSSLDAWGAHHRGLWHMYKFTAEDNRRAAECFRSAIALDVTFARPYAGLSFTHFQNVFLELTPDRERQIDLALETASQSLAIDDRDPAAHWATGRALWLRGELRDALSELRRSVELSPNFALGHYTIGFVESQSGDPRLAIEAVNVSRHLSPFDPLQFGMLSSRALAHMRLGETDEAVEWALRAIGRPNAHVHILAIAVSALSLANRRDEAGKLVQRIRERIPGYDVDRLVGAFRFDAATAALLRSGARRIGFDRSA